MISHYLTGTSGEGLVVLQKSLQALYESVGGLITNDVQMDGSNDQASKDTDPHFSTTCRVIVTNKQRASEINSGVAECWVFLDPKIR